MQSASAQIAQLRCSHEARLENEARQAAAQVNVANERLQASEAQAQLRLQEQAQLADMLIAELRRALKETSDQATANTRTAAELRGRCEKKYLKPTIASRSWSRHGICLLSQNITRKKRRASKNIQRRIRRLEDASDRSDPRLLASNPPSGAAADTMQLAKTSRRGQLLSGALVPDSASILEMFLPVSTGLERSARTPGPSSATVDSDAARVLEFNRGISSGHAKDAYQEGTGFSLTTLLRREELIPDSMRKTTRANLVTKTLKAFRNIFAHHKYSDARISDWVSYIPVDLHTQVRAGIRSVIRNRHKTIHCGTSGQLAGHGCVINGAGCSN